MTACFMAFVAVLLFEWKWVFRMFIISLTTVHRSLQLLALEATLSSRRSTTSDFYHIHSFLRVFFFLSIKQGSLWFLTRLAALLTVSEMLEIFVSNDIIILSKFRCYYLNRTDRLMKLIAIPLIRMNHDVWSAGDR